MVLVVKCLICHKELPYTQTDPSELINHVRTEHPLASHRSRKSVKEIQSRKARAQNDLQNLKRNSASLKSLIDKEIQTEFVWDHFIKMNKQNELKSLSSSSTEAVESSNKHFNATVLNKPPPKPPRKFSPARPIDDNVIRTHDKTPPPKPPRTFTHVIPEEETNHKIQMNIGKHARVQYKSKQEVEPSSLSHQQERKERKHRKFYKTSIEKWKPIGDEKIHCPRCRSHKRPIVRTQTERVTQSSFASTLVMTCWPLCFSQCLFPEPIQENLHCPVCNYHLGVYDHTKNVALPNPEILRES